MGDLVDGGGSFLYRGELLLDAGGLLLRGGADFGNCRAEIGGGFTALRRQVL